MKIKPMRYHYPGWTAESDDTEYMVWAPGEITHAGHSTGKTRDHWQTCWIADEGNREDLRKGGSWAEVAVIFPPAVTKAFGQAIKEAGLS